MGGKKPIGAAPSRGHGHHHFGAHRPAPPTQRGMHSSETCSAPHELFGSIWTLPQQTPSTQRVACEPDGVPMDASAAAAARPSAQLVAEAKGRAERPGLADPGGGERAAVDNSAHRASKVALLEARLGELAVELRALKDGGARAAEEEKRGGLTETSLQAPGAPTSPMGPKSRSWPLVAPRASPGASPCAPSPDWGGGGGGVGGLDALRELRQASEASCSGLDPLGLDPEVLDPFGVPFGGVALGKDDGLDFSGGRNTTDRGTLIGRAAGRGAEAREEAASPRLDRSPYLAALGAGAAASDLTSDLASDLGAAPRAGRPYAESPPEFREEAPSPRTSSSCSFGKGSGGNWGDSALRLPPTKRHPGGARRHGPRGHRGPELQSSGGGPSPSEHGCEPVSHLHPLAHPLMGSGLQGGGGQGATAWQRELRSLESRFVAVARAQEGRIGRLEDQVRKLTTEVEERDDKLLKLAALSSPATAGPLALAAPGGHPRAPLLEPARPGVAARGPKGGTPTSHPVVNSSGGGHMAGAPKGNGPAPAKACPADPPPTAKSPSNTAAAVDKVGEEVLRDLPREPPAQDKGKKNNRSLSAASKPFVPPPPAPKGRARAASASGAGELLGQLATLAAACGEAAAAPPGSTGAGTGPGGEEALTFGECLRRIGERMRTLEGRQGALQSKLAALDSVLGRTGAAWTTALKRLVNKIPQPEVNPAPSDDSPTGPAAPAPGDEASCQAQAAATTSARSTANSDGESSGSDESSGESSGGEGKAEGMASKERPRATDHRFARATSASRRGAVSTSSSSLDLAALLRRVESIERALERQSDDDPETYHRNRHPQALE